MGRREPLERREWAIGNGEWGRRTRYRSPIAHSPFPIPGSTTVYRPPFNATAERLRLLIPFPMHLARVVGRVVSTVKQESLEGVPLHWIQPLSADGGSVGEAIVAVNRIGAGPGEVVVYITSREAAIALGEPLSAVDAGIVAVVDRCELRGERTLDE